MPTLPVTQHEVGAIVREKSALYQPAGPRIPGDPASENKPSNATPLNLKLLLDQLAQYTKAVQVAAGEEGLTHDANVRQWASDMSHWQYRQAHYYEVLRTVAPQNAEDLVGADAVYFKVTAPLLDGIYYEVLPGTVLSADEKERIANGFGSNPKPPDLYIPFTLGNQVIEYREHQKERWEGLWKDLAEGAKRFGLPEGVWGTLKTVAITVASGLVGAGLTYTGIIVFGSQNRRVMVPTTPLHDAAYLEK
jgi:hypothetical protein